MTVPPVTAVGRAISTASNPGRHKIWRWGSPPGPLDEVLTLRLRHADPGARPAALRGQHAARVLLLPRCNHKAPPSQTAAPPSGTTNRRQESVKLVAGKVRLLQASTESVRISDYSYSRTPSRALELYPYMSTLVLLLEINPQNFTISKHSENSERPLLVFMQIG